MLGEPMILRNGTYIYGSDTANGGFVARVVSDETVMEEMGDEPCYVPEEEYEVEADDEKEEEEDADVAAQETLKPENVKDDEDDDDIQIIRVIEVKKTEDNVAEK